MARGLWLLIGLLCLPAGAAPAADDSLPVERDPAALPQFAIAWIGAEQYDVAGEVVALAFSPDAKFLAAGIVPSWQSGRPGAPELGRRSAYRVDLWCARTGHFVRTLCSMAEPPGEIAFSRTGEMLAVAPSLQLFEVATGREIRRCERLGQTLALAFSPDGKTLAGAGRFRAPLLWEVATGEWIRQFSHGATQIAFSQDGKHIVGACTDGKVRVWETATRRKVYEIADPPNATCFALLPDGKRLAIPGAKEIAIYHLRTGLPMASIEVPAVGVQAIAFAPDGKRMILCRASFVEVIQLSADERAVCTDRMDLPASRGSRADSTYPPAMAISPDCRLLAKGGSSWLRLWDLEAAKEITHDDAGARRAYALALSPDGRRLALTMSPRKYRAEFLPNKGWRAVPLDLKAEPGREFRVLEVPSLKELVRRSDSVEIADLLEEEQTPAPLVISPGAGTIRPLRPWSEERFCLPPLDKYSQPRTRAADLLPGCVFSPDGRHLLAVMDADYVESTSLEDPKGTPYSYFPPEIVTLQMSPDRRTLLFSITARYGVEDAQICDAVTGKTLWRLSSADKRPRRSAEFYAQLEFSGDGSKLITVGDNHREVTVYEARTGERIGHIRSRYDMWQLAVSADGKRLACISAEDRIALWDMESRKECLQLFGHSGGAINVLLTPDGNTLISGGGEGTILIWDLKRALAESRGPDR